MMNDLISRQAAIEALSLSKEMLNRVLDDTDVVGTDREKYSWGLGLIESNIKDIEELPSAQPERWIPVKEWLPEDGQWCLVTDGKRVSVERYKADIIDHFWPSPRWFNVDKMVAWMPLPEPYTEEGKEERSDEWT